MSKKYNDYYDDYDDLDYDFDFDIDFADDLNTHKTKDKVKWILTAIAFLLVAVMLIGICLQVFGKGGIKPTEWFNDEQTENVTFIPTEMSAMRLNTSRAVATGNTYTLTATVEPADATNGDVTWSIAWKNPDSTWASGKTLSNYITLSSDGLTATVTVKAAFGEQAIITVRSVSNTDIYATCTVDYVERLSIQHGGGYMDINRIYQNMTTDQVFAFGTTMNIKAAAQYSGTGTLRGELEFGTLTISLSDTIKNYITSKVSGYNSKYTTKSVTYDFSNGLNTSVNLASPTNFFNFMGNPSETSGAITNAFIAACKNGGTVRLEATFTYSYNGTNIQSGQAIGNFTVNTNGLAISVTNVGVDNSSLVF